jgi:pheophorbide a oxygenase
VSSKLISCTAAHLQFHSVCILGGTAYRYPALVLQDAKLDRPHATTILGKKLVLWADKTGDWHAFHDQCPHRLAALSEGRIEDGELACSYHGWQFDGVT